MPRIACFHGAGSNATIFEIQCSFLSSLLSPTYTLEFFNGPFDRPAGPGVLPAFDECGPYKSWFDPSSGAERNRTEGDGSGFDSVGRDGISRVLGLMEARSREKVFDQSEWVGVIGFSQGTRVVGGLLLDQQRYEDTQKGGIKARTVGKGIKLRFGVCCNGGGAPMESEIAFRLDNPSKVVQIPTLHVHGLKDEFLTNGREQLAKYYDASTAKLYEINYHHAMPWVKAESAELARLIKELDSRTRG
ncbi:serine hydrolase FSH [Aspergillus undulatus]|uniref:serine hydrolase FSH n=1 Tax=Aspergillus undulatus TaxID=1810928 RepID=UPI003CCDAAAD